MRTPAGPSLQVVYALSRALGDFAVAGLHTSWERWLGPQRFARKLAQLERDGLLERRSESEDTSRLVQLTEAGRLAAMGGRDLAAQWGRPWDGRWRMVFFDVSESKRTMRITLVRQLRRMRFGYLQDSVWISPDSLEAVHAVMRGASADAAMLTMLEATPCAGESDADLVRGAWDFTLINRTYDDHLKILRSFPAAGSDSARRNWMQTEWKAWTRAVNLDPLLPEALLPRGYRGREAWATRQERMARVIRPT